jgi:hypothetical protein
MNDKKVIQFNPNLLAVPGGNKTRKNKPKGKTIQYKKNKELNNKTTKQKLLRYIREQQEQKYKKTFEKPTEKNYEKNSVDVLDKMKVNGDFENSLNYLKSITDNYEKTHLKPNINQTIKHHNRDRSSHSYSTVNEPFIPTNYFNNIIPNNDFREPHVYSDLPDVFNNVIPNYPTSPNYISAHNQSVNNMFQVDNPAVRINPQFKLPPVPTYGCMKVGGKLPTIKQYMRNQTFKGPMPMNPPINPVKLLTEKEKELLYISKTMGKKKEENSKSTHNKLRYLKQKKTLTRTYKVGKSKTKPEVSVLISNKTIRNSISSKIQLLKQIPLNEVKQFLIKKGLIKIGSSAPTDVLRKMYESAVLIGGELNNFNSENILFNFFNNENHNDTTH